MAARLAWDEQFRKGIEADCALCSREDGASLREEWGCDAPRAEPWTQIDCFCCEPRNSRLCGVCGGRRELDIVRCPWSHMGPRERFVLDAVLMLESGVPPLQVAMPDWPAVLGRAINLVAAERSLILEERFDKN